MKKMALAAAAISLIVSSALPAMADPVDLPNSGTYFITSVSSGEALQPVGPTVGQNVLMYEYTKSGLQKWTITRKIDPKTQKPTNRYTIRLAGENGDLNFEPHPVAERTAMIGTDKSVFVFEPGEAGILIKSVTNNGDALFVYPYPPMNSEARFGANDGSAKYRWLFTHAE